MTDMPIEIIIRIKADESTYKEKFFIYEPIYLTRDCQELNSLIEMAKSKFKVSAPVDIYVTTKMVW